MKNIQLIKEGSFYTFLYEQENISGYGNTIYEAVESFRHGVEMWADDMIKEVLKEQGLTYTPKKRGLKAEVLKRFGSNWKTTLIKEEGYPFNEGKVYNDLCFHDFIDEDLDEVWSKNGLIYSHGVWADPKEEKL